MRISFSNAGYTTFGGGVRVLATHSVRQFPLHFPSHASPCATRFRTSSTCILLYTRIFGSELAVSRCSECANHSCLSGTCRLKETTRLHIPDHNNPDLFPLSVYPFIISLQSVLLYVASKSCIIYTRALQVSTQSCQKYQFDG